VVEIYRCIGGRHFQRLQGRELDMTPCRRVNFTDVQIVDGGGIFVQQVDKFLPDYTASHPRRRWCS
jgi:hypothetical protein